MRALDSLTQNLIESLVHLLEQPVEDALQTLEVCAPVLIEQLQEVVIRAVDRRDVESQLQTVLANWLKHHPQPDDAETELLEALRKQALLSSKPVEALA